MRKIYLDYAATTPVAPAVLKAMQPYLSKKFGNPGSLHSFGQEASAALDQSREIVTEALGADFREVVFTSGATEANNLALKGVLKEFRIQNLEFSNSLNTKSYIPNHRAIVSTIEHESVLETARDLEREGVEVIYLPVNREGLVDLEKLKTALNERTILVSIQYANNEIGTIQPISEIAKIIAEFRDAKNANTRECHEKQKNNLQHSYKFVVSHRLPLLHTDATQAFQYLDCDVQKLGVDLMTLSAHKIYGPKGIGALYVKNQKSKIKNKKLGSDFIAPIITGGGQEYNLRSGTENVAAAVGFAKAIKIVLSSKYQEARRVKELRNYFWNKLKKISPKIELNGPAAKELRVNSGYSNEFIDWGRLPNNLNIYFPGQSADDLLIKLDMAGIAVSAGSACSARGTEPSHVLRVCGFPPERIKSSLRFSLGRPTTKKEIDDVIKRMEKVFRN